MSENKESYPKIYANCYSLSDEPVRNKIAMIPKILGPNYKKFYNIEIKRYSTLSITLTIRGHHAFLCKSKYGNRNYQAFNYSEDSTYTTSNFKNSTIERLIQNLITQHYSRWNGTRVSYISPAGRNISRILKISKNDFKVFVKSLKEIEYPKMINIESKVVPGKIIDIVNTQNEKICYKCAQLFKSVSWKGWETKYLSIDQVYQCENCFPELTEKLKHEQKERNRFRKEICLLSIFLGVDSLLTAFSLYLSGINALTLLIPYLLMGLLVFFSINFEHRRRNTILNPTYDSTDIHQEFWYPQNIFKTRFHYIQLIILQIFLIGDCSVIFLSLIGSIILSLLSGIIYFLIQYFMFPKLKKWVIKEHQQLSDSDLLSRMKMYLNDPDIKKGRKLLLQTNKQIKVCNKYGFVHLVQDLNQIQATFKSNIESLIVFQDELQNLKKQIELQHYSLIMDQLESLSVSIELIRSKDLLDQLSEIKINVARLLDDEFNELNTQLNTLKTVTKENRYLDAMSLLGQIQSKYEILHSGSSPKGKFVIDLPKWSERVNDAEKRYKISVAYFKLSKKTSQGKISELSQISGVDEQFVAKFISELHQQGKLQGNYDPQSQIIRFFDTKSSME